jgi:hypothetical protein
MMMMMTGLGLTVMVIPRHIITEPQQPNNGSRVTTFPAWSIPNAKFNFGYLSGSYVMGIYNS